MFSQATLKKSAPSPFGRSGRVSGPWPPANDRLSPNAITVIRSSGRCAVVRSFGRSVVRSLGRSVVRSEGRRLKYQRAPPRVVQPDAAGRNRHRPVQPELVATLADEHQIDVFVDQHNLNGWPPPAGSPIRSAHDFVWEHHTRPYDLTIYQLGNSSHHDYQWPYLFRYPGMVVLHDAHLHHARAACLLRTFRAADYRIEFAPEPSRGERRSRRARHCGLRQPSALRVADDSARREPIAPRGRPSAAALRGCARKRPARTIDIVRLGHGIVLDDEECRRLGARARERFRIPDAALVFGCYGGLTPDKRLPQILARVRGDARVSRRRVSCCSPARRLRTTTFAPKSTGAACGLHATITGYLESDEDIAGAIAACDVA